MKYVIKTLPCFILEWVFLFSIYYCLYLGILVHIQRYTSFDLYTSTFVSRARPHLLVRSVKAVFRDDGPFDVHFKPDKAITWTSPDLESAVDEMNKLLYDFPLRYCLD